MRIFQKQSECWNRDVNDRIICDMEDSTHENLIKWIQPLQQRNGDRPWRTSIKSVIRHKFIKDTAETMVSYSRNVRHNCVSPVECRRFIFNRKRAEKICAFLFLRKR